MKGLNHFVILILLGLLVGLFSTTSLFAKNPFVPKVVEVEKPRLADLTHTVRLIGILRSKRSTLLTAKTKGVLDHIKDPGERVLKGQLIAKLNNLEIQKHYEFARESAEIAKKQYDRVLKLKQAKVISSVDSENKKIHWLTAQKTLSEAKIEYDKTQFLAPFDGLVGIYKLHEGTQVQPGDPIVYFYDPENLVVEFNIPEPILEKLSDQSQVMIRDKTIDLPYIQKMIDPKTHMAPAFVNYRCKNCVIGRSVSVDLVVQKKAQCLVIPYGAVFLKNTKFHVYLVKDSKVILTEVQLGIRSKHHVEILSGITLKDQFIATGHERLYPSQSITVKTDQAVP